MAGTVTVEWWFRWQELEGARAARQAWEHQQRAKNPAEELSDEERELIGDTRPEGDLSG